MGGRRVHGVYLGYHRGYSMPVRHHHNSSREIPVSKRQLVKVNQDMYARLFKILLDDPCTAHDLSEETGMHIITAQSLMRTLKKHKVVHVCAWEADRLGRDVTPVYKLGEGRDKKRHKFTAAERTARYRAKKMTIAALLCARSDDGHSDNRL